MMKVVVYTAVFDNYDTLLDQPYNPQARYVCFGNAPQPSNTWEFIKVDRYQSSATRDARYCKVMSHHFVTKDEYCIWLDANLVLWDDPIKICNKWLVSADMAVFKHPHRDCIYDEVKACEHYSKDDSKIMRKQVARYRTEGYPKHDGLIWTAFIARRQTEEVKLFNDMWWKEIMAGSHRDQLGFPYVLKKMGIRTQFVSNGIRDALEVSYDHRHSAYRG